MTESVLSERERMRDCIKHRETTKDNDQVPEIQKSRDAEREPTQRKSGPAGETGKGPDHQSKSKEN
eukprot:6213616-Pleurochrysis_carterae.AAC.1